MPAHVAPLGIEFSGGQDCESEGTGAFPCDVKGDAFVGFHGSWNSDVPVGFRLVRIPFTKTGDHVPTGEMIDIIYEGDTTACYGTPCFRPVNGIFNRKGHLIISDDENDAIIRVIYDPNGRGSGGRMGLGVGPVLLVFASLFKRLI